MESMTQSPTFDDKLNRLESQADRIEAMIDALETRITAIEEHDAKAEQA